MLLQLRTFQKYHALEQHQCKLLAPPSGQCTYADYVLKRNLLRTGLHAGLQIHAHVPTCRPYAYALKYVNLLKPTGYVMCQHF
jgi:hypothetical protein